MGLAEMSDDEKLRVFVVGPPERSVIAAELLRRDRNADVNVIDDFPRQYQLGIDNYPPVPLTPLPPLSVALQPTRETRNQRKRRRRKRDRR
jgi:hypothetical protein